MSYTKRQLVEDAYAELALAGYVFDLQPEEMQWGLRRLDAMMARLIAAGMSVPYAVSGINDSDLDQDSGLPLGFVEAIYLELAQSLAAGKGKNLMPSSVSRAYMAMQDVRNILAMSAVREQQQVSWMPRGAGSKSWMIRNRDFFNTPKPDVLAQDDNGDLKLGEL